jgi:hypothetical protein
MNSERSAHFGLGDAHLVARLDVEFHDGSIVRLRRVPSNRSLTVAVPESRADLTQPLGVRDLADVVAFLGLYLDGHRAADLAAPIGVIDQADIAAYVALFNAE